MPAGMDTTAVTAAAPVIRSGGNGAALRGLHPPTVVEWLKEIAAVTGPERALEAWMQAAMATGNHGMSLDADRMEQTGQWLVSHTTDVPLRMAVRSCLVQLRTYRVLAKTAGKAAGGDR